MRTLTGTAYKREGRSAEAWEASLRQQWIKLRLKPCDPRPNLDSAYADKELKPVMDLKGGKGGEVERYILTVGGWEKEL